MKMLTIINKLMPIRVCYFRSYYLRQQLVVNSLVPSTRRQPDHNTDGRYELVFTQDVSDQLKERFYKMHIWVERRCKSRIQ